jgi:hypothetical protein
MRTLLCRLELHAISAAFAQPASKFFLGISPRHTVLEVAEAAGCMTTSKISLHFRVGRKLGAFLIGL